MVLKSLSSSLIIRIMTIIKLLLAWRSLEYGLWTKSSFSNRLYSLFWPMTWPNGLAQPSYGIILKTGANSMTTRKKYPKEFKLDAISLVLEQEYTNAEVSRSLGINPNFIAR